MIRLCCAVLILAGTPLYAGDPSVKLTRHDDAVSVQIDGHEFTTYHFAKAQAKPYFSPVRAADGAVITRAIEEKPEDHPHHKGIWTAIDSVNGLNFWAEKDRIENIKVEILKPEGNPAKLRVTNHWLTKEGMPLLIEQTDISIYAQRLFAYDIRLTAGTRPVEFGDTKEGLFGLRVANTLREKKGGSIINAEGKKGSKQAWGLESAWVDYFGDVGGKVYGVALFDNPTNFRKSRYHVRDYGLFTISPFGPSAYTNGKIPAKSIVLEPGKSIELRYGLYVHDGDTAQGKVTDAYRFYLQHEAQPIAAK